MLIKLLAYTTETRLESSQNRNRGAEKTMLKNFTN